MSKLPLRLGTWVEYKFPKFKWLAGWILGSWCQAECQQILNCLHLICKFIAILIYAHFPTVSYLLILEACMTVHAHLGVGRAVRRLATESVKISGAATAQTKHGRMREARSFLLRQT